MNKDINNPDDYEFKAKDVCLVKGCLKPVEWFLDEGIGLCDDCFGLLEKGKLTLKK